MKLLLNENLPQQLKNDFIEHEIYHITDLRWNGIKNGELLKLMLAERFDVLLIFDKFYAINKIFKSIILPFLYW